MSHDHDGPRPALPPQWLVAALAARGQWPSVRHLESVVESPVLRWDGSVLDVPGHDPATGLLYEPSARFGPVLAQPSVDAVRDAVDLLLGVVLDFPFRSPADRAAWLAALLTPLARFAYRGPTPLFLLDANVPGAGKTLLAEVVAHTVTGRAMARTTYPERDEELRKQITATALAGDLLVLLDNIARTFGGPSLDAALTATSWRDRILGRTEMIELPLHTVWFASGNNFALKGDAIRRVIPIRLESPMERPEERSCFAIQEPLIEYVGRRRVELVTAALTILCGFIDAGKPLPSGLTPFGSFEGWSGLVRGAVIWATDEDPCATRKDLLADDEDTRTRAAIIEGWAELPGAERGVSAADAIALLQDRPAEFGMLREAIRSAKTGELPSAKSLGRLLSGLRGRVSAGYRIVRVMGAHNLVTWKASTAA